MRQRNQKNFDLPEEILADLELASRNLDRPQAGIVRDSLRFTFGSRDANLMNRLREIAEVMRQKSGQHLANKGDSNA